LTSPKLQQEDSKWSAAVRRSYLSFDQFLTARVNKPFSMSAADMKIIINGDLEFNAEETL
jgi:hypothetical protein